MLSGYGKTSSETLNIKKRTGSVLCGDLTGKEIKRGDICIRITDFVLLETNTTFLKQLYTNKIFKKRGLGA